jgi:hypothetical protein
MHVFAECLPVEDIAIGCTSIKKHLNISLLQLFNFVVSDERGTVRAVAHCVMEVKVARGVRRPHDGGMV